MKGIQKLSCHWSRLLLSGESFDRDCLCKRVETVECGKRPKRNEMASYSKGASRLGGGLSWGLLKKRGRGGWEDFVTEARGPGRKCQSVGSECAGRRLFDIGRGCQLEK